MYDIMKGGEYYMEGEEKRVQVQSNSEYEEQLEMVEGECLVGKKDFEGQRDGWGLDNCLSFG